MNQVCSTILEKNNNESDLQYNLINRNLHGVGWTQEGVVHV